MAAPLASDTAMVLAAGLGKRMRPLTASQPKPLVRVAGKPLIDHALDRLAAAGVNNAVVNVHYLADALQAHLKRTADGLDVKISDERELLLVPHARAMNHSGLGDFHLDRAGKLRRRGRSRVAPFVFTGIQIVSKALLKDAPEGPFSTNILWDRAIAAGRCFGAVHQGLWFDVGKPQSIKATEQVLANV